MPLLPEIWHAWQSRRFNSCRISVAGRTCGQPSPTLRFTASNGSALDTAVAAIITIDEGGTIESANASVERVFGYAPESR